MKKMIALSMAAALVFAVSCKKDAAPALSATEAKTTLDASSTNISTEMEGIQKAEGVVALGNMTSATIPFGNPMKYALNVTKSQTLKELKAVQGSAFDFEASKGVWEYNDVTKGLDKKGTETICIIKFPSDSTKMTVNDATLTISEYTEVQIIDKTYPQWPDTSFQPTKITGNVKIGAKIVVDVKFAASYTATGDPKTVDATVAVTPYALSVQYIDGGITQTLNGSFKNGARIILAAGVKITWPSATDRDTVPTNVDGYVQIDNIKVTGSVNVKGMDGISTEHPTAADLNNNVKLTMTKADNGALIGTFKAYDEKDANNVATVVPYIVYSDGTTKENAITYASTFMEKVQAKLPK